MTILSIAQDVAREIGFEPPNYIIGNTDTTARQLLTLISREGEWLVRRHAWAVLQKEFTITTISGQSAYALPVDYHRLVGDSFWNRSNTRIIDGPVNPQHWQHRKANSLQAGQYYSFRIKPDNGTLKVFLDPTPTSNGEILTTEYISKNWVRNASGLSADITADNDMDIFPQGLLQLGLCWRFMSAKGLDFSAIRMEYEQELNAAIAQDSNMPSFGNRKISAILNADNLPDRDYGI